MINYKEKDHIYTHTITKQVKNYCSYVYIVMTSRQKLGIISNLCGYQFVNQEIL